MTDIIAKIFEMSILGSVVIAITILARLLLKKKSKSLIMILWAAVAIRLLCPISIESSFSLFNLLPQSSVISKVEEQVANTKPAEVNKGNVANNATSNEASSNKVTNTNANSNANLATPNNTHANNVVNSKPSNTNNIKAPAVIANNNEVANEKVSKATTSISVGTVLGIVWVAGSVILLAYIAFSYIHLSKRLKDSYEIEDNVFESDKIPSPFVFGLVKPRIYIPIGLGETEKRLILTHERIHIKKGDYLSKIVGMICVCIHWFNPVVWLAFMLFEQDTEMRCDETVLRELGPDIKEKYSLSLVSFAMRNRDMRYAVLPVSFSKAKFNKNEVTIRVKNLISYKSGSKIVAAIIAVTLFAVSTACSLNAKANDTDNKDIAKTEVTETTEEKETTTTSETSKETEETTTETTLESVDETEADETEATEVEETTEETTVETKEEVVFDELAAISEDIEAIKAYHDSHPDKASYIGWNIWPGSEHVSFIIYTPNSSDKATVTTVEPFTFDLYQNPEAPNMEVVYGDLNSSNNVIAADSCYLEDTIDVDYWPNCSYNEFIKLTPEEILDASINGASSNIPNVTTLEDGVYYGIVHTDSFSGDFGSATFTVGKILSQGAYDDTIIIDSVNATLPITKDCIFFDSGLSTAGGRSEQLTFETSRFYKALNGEELTDGSYSYSIEEGYSSAYIKVTNGTVVAMDLNYWL